MGMMSRSHNLLHLDVSELQALFCLTFSFLAVLGLCLRFLMLVWFVLRNACEQATVRELRTESHDLKGKIETLEAQQPITLFLFWSCVLGWVSAVLWCVGYVRGASCVGCE